MGKYTEFLEQEWKEIYPEDDDYTEKLIDFAKKFRYFDEGLTEFMAEHGYTGDLDDVDGKAAFIKEKFENAGVPVPRNIKSWFLEHKYVKRKTAFQICFAFELTIEETENFFRKIFFERGFDCHHTEEAIFYYAMKHGLTYTDAEQIKAKSPKTDTERIDFSKDVLYTSSIVEEINRFDNSDDLIKFFYDNESQFGYNNATAYKYINEIWKKITTEGGLADREQQELFFDNKKRKKSIWEIYLQILGFEKSHVDVLKTDRSLKPILQDNVLLHPIAQASFPDNEGIQIILSGKHVSYDRVRKLIILLVFYKYWVTLALKRKNATYEAEGGDADRCQSEINRYLLETGYPALYLGNPYDWLFLFAMQDQYPLLTFRGYMNELFVNKENELGIREHYMIVE